MAEEAAPQTVAETAEDTEPRWHQPGPGQASPGHQPHHGRPASWATSAIVIAGFIIGGIALITGPTWWLFWTGTGIVVLGIIVGAGVHIFDDWY